MARRFTIGQLAAAAGVPTTTVRYYERRALLGPAARLGSGHYRSYGDEELERLRFIRAAQATGFSLQDVAALLGLRDGASEPCKEVQDLIEKRLGDVGRRLEDLRHVEKVLKASLKLCRRYEKTGRCEVMSALAGTTRSPGAQR